MLKEKQLFVFLLIALTGIHSTLAEDGNPSVGLPNYVVGIVAVACFLVLTFAFLLFNHYVCAKFYEEEDDDEDDEAFNSVSENKAANRPIYEEVEEISKSGADYVNESFVEESKSQQVTSL